MNIENAGKSMNGSALTDEEKYLQSCRTTFWQDVFRVEYEYLARHLQGCKDILSVGCGPAIVETQLSNHGFAVTGLDISQEALSCVPEGIRTIVGRAENLPFPDCFFDAVVFIASLQFVEDYKKAINETARVLRDKGKLVAMLLNPEADSYSYVQKMRHLRLDEMENFITKKFRVKAEYYLGIKDGLILENRNPVETVLYIIRGISL